MKRGGRGNVIDETGQVFGVVTVLARAGLLGNGTTAWVCLCSVCGGTRVIRGTQLRREPPKKCLRRCEVAGREAAQ